MSAPVQLPDDAQARQRLAAAHDYIKVQSWPEAVRLLQSLLDARTDSFRRTIDRDKHGKISQRWTSLRTEAEHLLANLPKAGKDFYLLTYEAPARRALTARARQDRAALHEVARRYRYTRAGVEALELLGSSYLDRGQPDLAAACYRHLLDYPGADRLAPLTLFKAALAAHVTRTTDERPTTAWQKLSERIGRDGLQIGKDTYDIDKLRNILEGWPGGPTGDWPLYRGDPRRSARGPGDFFLLEPQWHIATADGETRQWLRRAAASSPFVAPAATPLALDGKLVYRAADGLHALDAQTGRPLWHSPTPLSLEAVLRDPGKKVQLRKWLRLYGPAGAALLENSTLGTLSSDGRHVYAVEDLPLPPYPELLQNDNGQVHSLGPLRHVVGHNCLRALDPATGRVVWEIGGPSPAANRARKPKIENPLTEAFFLGPPLPLGDQVFALVEKQQELRLVCLDAERGTVRWTQMLATARTKMLLDVVRHTQAAHLAYAEGVLVCPTHSGAILGVDPLSRNLLWAYVYAQPVSVREDVPAEMPSARLRSDWKGCAPIVYAGRVLFTPLDSDKLHVLNLHDGSLVWQAARREDDLYAGCVHKDAVLVVSKTACRSLSLTTGETLWQRPTGLPAGQGVAAGPIYYLPLKQGAILALNLEKPGDSVRLDAHGALRGGLGNLVFHRGVLWSQSATEVLALTPLTTQLARIARRLMQTPRDPALLYEHGRLRLDKGDVAGGAADLHNALASSPAPALRPAIRERLFAALTQLLQHDFAAGEKYLNEYQALCRVPIPDAAGPDLRLALEKEQRRRQMHYLALVALGREKQGHVLDALHAYADLSRRPSSELMTVPDDPAVQTRPDLWVQGRIAALLAHANPQQRRLLTQRIRVEELTLAASPDRGAWQHFLALFGAIEGDEASRIREASLRLAQSLARIPGRGRALEAERFLLGLVENRGEKRSAMEASALYEQALLLTRQGLLDEAVVCYQRLAREYPDTAIDGGRTGSQLLGDLHSDKRFLAHVEAPSDPWTGRAIEPVVLSRGLPVLPMRLPCLPCQETDLSGNSQDLAHPVSEVPPSCRHLRFTLDGVKLQLHVSDRTSGAERYTIPLPLTGVPPILRNSEVYYQAVDHLLVLCVGPTLLGVDLFERRVRWTRRVLDGSRFTSDDIIPQSDGGILLGTSTERFQRVGLIGPIGRSAVCVQTPRGLVALDPLSGEVIWQRADVPSNFAVFGDEEYLFLADRLGDRNVRSVRAIRARDGVSVSIPDASASCANLWRILGRLLLVAEPGPSQTRHLRLYDPLTGKDLWRTTLRAGTVLLQSTDSRWLGIVEPEGTVLVVDLARRQEIARLQLDKRHLDKVYGGVLLADRQRFYVALQGPIDPALHIVGAPSPNFRTGLDSVHVHGMVYAFDRIGGAPRWVNWLPVQELLLEQFEELPILLCSAVSTRPHPRDSGNNVVVVATRSFDKRTGKLLYNKEVVAPNGSSLDLFHTLRIDPRSGAIDLLCATRTLRHIPTSRK